MATYSSSYDLSSVTHSQYGTRGNSWTNTTNQGTNDGDNNAYYIGHGQWNNGSWDNFRPRLYFKIPSTLQMSGTSRLTVKIVSGQAWTPGYMRAYLSTKNTTTSDTKYIVGSSSTAADRLAMSYLYSDIEGTTQQTASMSLSSGKTKACYLIFDYEFKAGTTYYIYMLPYDSNSAGIDSWSFSNTWGQPRNLNSSWTQVILNYNNGAVRINIDGTADGWRLAIPYVNIDGTADGWKQAIPYINTNGTADGWKISS